jgi:hypothetical protein
MSFGRKSSGRTAFGRHGIVDQSTVVFAIFRAALTNRCVGQMSVGQMPADQMS